MAIEAGPTWYVAMVRMATFSCECDRYDGELSIVEGIASSYVRSEWL